MSIDRGTLAKLLYGRGLVPADRVTEVIDGILALVRPVEDVRELDGWLVWSAHNTARLFKDEERDEARAFAFQVLGALYKVELIEVFS